MLAADCPSRPVLKHLTSQWGVLVMLALRDGTHAVFGAAAADWRGVSERMLAQTLQVLEGDGLVLRAAHQVVPPHVDYALTPLGMEAAARVAELTGWIEAKLGEILAARGQAASAGVPPPGTREILPDRPSICRSVPTAGRTGRSCGP